MVVYARERHARVGLKCPSVEWPTLSAVLGGSGRVAASNGDVLPFRLHLVTENSAAHETSVNTRNIELGKTRLTTSIIRSFLRRFIRFADASLTSSLSRLIMLKH